MLLLRTGESLDIKIILIKFWHQFYLGIGFPISEVPKTHGYAVRGDLKLQTVLHSTLFAVKCDIPIANNN